MKKPAFCNWDEVPLVAGIDDAARVLNRSVASIYRACQAGTMCPAPMPRVGKTAPLQWSKAVLQEFVDGKGYEKQRATPGRRRYFAQSRAKENRLREVS